jgi:hypothetical protein
MTSPADRVVIRHPDGRSYSVTRKAFGAIYEDKGFWIVEPETEASFIHDVPPNPSRAGARRKTVKTARKPA